MLTFPQHDYSEASPEPSDEQLVWRAQQGDETAFTLIFQRYYVPLWRFFNRLINCVDDVDDLCQNTFNKAFNHILTIKNTETFRGWLFTIAANTARDYWRKKQRRKRFIIVSFDNARDKEAEVEFEKQVIEAINLEKAAAEVKAQVSARQWECFLLHYHGHSKDEIAEKMNLGKGTVSTYISQVRDMYRRAFRRLD